ncbi:MAG: MMPL family transporter, partial [Actinomycetota bacterium]
MKMTPEALARSSSRRPWLTIAIWLMAIVTAGVVTSTWLDGVLTTEGNFTNDPEAKQALELIEERFGAEGVSEIFIVSSATNTVDDPAFAAEVRDLQAGLEETAGSDLMGAVSFYDTNDESLVSEDRDTALIQATFVDTGDVSDHLATVRQVERAGNDAGFSTRTFGAVSLEDEFSRIAEEDLAKGETFGILIALVVLLAVFGAVVAGLVPIAMAVAAIAVALGVVAAVGQQFEFSFFVTNMNTMMGLAVGIDYALFIVSRYREERA